MAHAEKRITAPRSGPEVFAFLSDVANMPAWIPAVQRLDLVNGAAGTVGAEYAVAVDIGGSTRSGRLTIVRLDPPRGIGIRISASPIRIEGTVAIDDHGDRSDVTVALDAPTGGLLRLMDGQIAQALDGALEELPRLADAVP